jgi:shikimate dehydrogenase
VSIGGPPRRCAVLGSPIRHSLSPALHRAAYRHLGLPWRYDAIEVGEADLSPFVAGLDASWRGLSLTMPLKRAVLALADTRSVRCDVVGAANTLLLEPSGARVVENTDVPGVQGMLATAGVAGLGPVALLGGGATAASVVAALATPGVPVTAVVRSAERVAELMAVAERAGTTLRVERWDDAAVAAALAAPVVVVTLPGDAAAALAPAVPPQPGTLLDVTYHPWPTTLASAWLRNGGAVVGGLELLVQQAAEQVRLMTGVSVPVEVLREAGAAGLAAASGRPG